MLKKLSLILFFLCLMSPAMAQNISLDLGENASGTVTGNIIEIILIITVLSVAPGILIMATSFTRILIVFSIVRQALATGQTPPNMVMVSLAMFMTAFIMAPTFEKAWNDGIVPITEERVETMEGLELASKPFKKFMLDNVREKDLQLFVDMHKDLKVETIDEVPMSALLPAFMISELRRAFEIGFLIYLPFIIIDMIIASVLMSMGMMMLPPTMLAMPFKLIFFVMIDGWFLLTGSLVNSFNK